MDPSEPSDQLGDIDDPPWAGLWAWLENVGVIVVRQPLSAGGTMSLYVYDNEQEMRNAWMAMQLTVEDGPKDDDLIIWCPVVEHTEAGDIEFWNVCHKNAYPGRMNEYGSLKSRESALRYAKIHAEVAGRQINVWLFDGHDYKLMQLPD